MILFELRLFNYNLFGLLALLNEFGLLVLLNEFGLLDLLGLKSRRDIACA
jgi:hypothetical protein